MDGLEQLIQEHPPIEHADSRFGNLAFRSWYDAMEKVGFLSVVASRLIHLELSLFVRKFHAGGMNHKL